LLSAIVILRTNSQVPVIVAISNDDGDDYDITLNNTAIL
jgi:3-deoxy-D-arabino-heptulosonate 7-phosphate (DAHP) synthase